MGSMGTLVGSALQGRNKAIVSIEGMCEVCSVSRVGEGNAIT